MSVNSAAVGPIEGVEIPTIPVGKLAPWALFTFLLAAIVVFFISADQGAISIPAGTAIHEWVHDGRHLLGFPCH
jgi:apolipoprotein N-acyltransferase